MEPGRRRTLIAALTIAGLTVPATHDAAGASGPQEDVLTAVTVATPTRDTTPDVQVTVTGDDATAVEYRVAGEPAWTAVTGWSNTPGSDDTVTFTPTLPPDTTSTVEIRALDAGTAELDRDTVDVAVDVTVVAVLGGVSGRTNDPTPTVTVDAEPGAVATWTLDGVGQGSAGLDGSGDATVTMPLLADGPHTAVFSLQDAVGNTAERTVTFDVDTVAPTFAVSTVPSPVADASPTLTVTDVESDATVTFVVDGGTPATATVTAGTATIVPGPLADGPHVVLVTVTDAAGNAATTTRAFTVDTVAPGAPVPGTPSVSGGTATVPVTWAEAGGVRQVRVDGGPWTPWTGASLAGLADGTRVIGFRQTDDAGNVGATGTTAAFTVDTVAPAAPVLGGVVLDGTTATVAVTWAEADGTREVQVNGGAWQPWTTAAVAGLPQGTVVLGYRQTDPHGNVGGVAATAPFTVDTVAPPAPVVGAPVVVGRTAAVPVTWAEAGGTRQVRRSSDGGVTWTAWSAWGGSVAGLATATWRLEFRQVDAAGNVGATAATDVTVAVDDVAPALEVGAPAGPVTIAAVSVAVDSEPGATVGYRVNGGGWVTVALDGAGRGSFTLSGLANGTHRVEVDALDAVGNRAALEFPVVFAVPPAAPAPLPRAGLVGPSGPVTVSDGVVRRLPITLPATLPAPVTAASTTASGGGAWVADAAGRVYTSGDAVDRGDLARLGIVPNRPINGMAPTVTGQGYWLVAADGGIFAFGDARFLGSMGGQRLNRPITAMAPTPSGQGYWLVAADGGIFAFGDAPFLGSTGAIPLNRPINGMAATPTGNGYWLFADDGGVFAFGDARFFGSLPGVPEARGATAVGMIPTPTNLGYWIVTNDNRVFAFGDARR